MSDATTTTNDDSPDTDSDTDSDAPSTQTHTGADGTTTITNDGHGTIKTVTVGPGGTQTSTTTASSRDDEAPRIGPDGMHGFHWWMAIVLALIAASLIKTSIRARHGDTRTNRQRRRDERAGIGFQPTANRENEALAEENAKLRAQATRMEDRIAVLERIVTDPAKRVSDEIDALR